MEESILHGLLLSTGGENSMKTIKLNLLNGECDALLTALSVLGMNACSLIKSTTEEQRKSKDYENTTTFITYLVSLTAKVEDQLNKAKKTEDWTL